MYGKKGAVLTLKSLRTLPKVCSFPYLRHINTASERLHFDSPNGLPDEQYVNCKGNPKGFYEDSKKMNHGRGGNWNVRENSGNFRRKLDGFHGESEVKQQNPSGIFGKTVVSGKQRDPTGNYVISDRNSNPVNAYNNGFQQKHNGLDRGMPSRYTVEGERNEFQHSAVRQSFGPGGGFDYVQQNVNGFHGNPSGNNHNFFNGNPGQTRRDEHPQSSVSQSASSGYGDPFQAQQNINRTFTEVQRSGYSFGNGISQQNAASYDVRNLGVSGQTYSQHYDATPRSFQNNQAWPNANNNGILQQNVGAVSNNDASANGDVHKAMKGTIQELDDFLSVGNLEEAVKVLTLLKKQGTVVDLSRYLALMKVCGENDSLEEAKAIHEHLIRSAPNLEVSTYNRILEMYSACGSMKDAFRVFDAMTRNLISWDIMITGLANNGHPEAAIDLFTELRELGLKPDGQIYLGIFLACKALFDVTEGLLHFEAMSKDYGIVPSTEHYMGIIDMLGSVGHLDEALEFIEKMPIEPGVEVWEKLMNLSRIQGNVELGDRCAELVELLDPSLLNEQSRAGLLPLEVLDSAKKKEKKKEHGQNPLELRSRVHEYRAGDRTDPDSEKLYALLYGLKEQMKESGYVPELKGVLHDIDPESKEEALLGHSERLAVSRGLLSTAARHPLRVIKNLRICVDCHNAMKIISKLVGRELVMRDAKRFHHFKDGICSCRDYW